MIKTGLIGHGYWGKIIEQKLNEVSELKFIQTKNNYNIDVFNTVDWIFIATTIESHFEIAIDCIMAGVNVFIEKPATETEPKYKFLIKLAKGKKVNIYVSNVFLFRKELIGNKKICSPITFTWYKDKVLESSIINDLLYHDLYILISVYGENKIEYLDVYANQPNRLFFSLKCWDTKVYFDYRRAGGLETKKLINFGYGAINLPKTEQDPLKEMITQCLNNDINFNANFELNLHTLKLMDIIKQKLK